MGRITNIDPNFAQEQVRFFHSKALKQAKGAGAVSSKKALIIIVPVFLAAIAVILLFSGIFGHDPALRYQGVTYQIIQDPVLHELPDSYGPVGKLVHVDDLKKDSADLESDWNLEAQLFADPDNPGIVYISAYGGYLECKAKR